MMHDNRAKLPQAPTTRRPTRACHGAAQMAYHSLLSGRRRTLRHSFATHLGEQNIDVRMI
jgi:site-specific recombinase XerD